MKIVLFSSDFNTLDEWKNKKNDLKATLCYELSSLADELKTDREAL